MIALAQNHIDSLEKAISYYSFPTVCYDFKNGVLAPQPDMRSVEEYIGNDLRSGDLELVKNGLSNVLFWGYAQIGYRDKRVTKFRNEVTVGKLHDAARLFSEIQGDGLLEIKRLGLPQFSGMSFISKVRMFLNPGSYVILDRQILKMNDFTSNTVLSQISFGEKETQIRISKKNVGVYIKWCRKCRSTAELFYEGRYRAVDIERGFFTLIQDGRVELAANILSAA